MIRFIFILAFGSFSSGIVAQGKIEDYQRAEHARTLFKNKVFNSPSSFHWIKSQHKCWYINNARNGKEFILVDADKKSQQRAFNQVALAKNLSTLLRKNIKSGELPFDWIEYASDLKSFSFQVDSAKMSCEVSSLHCRVTEIVTPGNRNEVYWGNAFNEKDNLPVKSPDSLWVAFIRDNNLYIRSRKSREEIQLSYDGNGGTYYSSYMQWSPDSKKIVAYKVTPGERRMIYFVESSPSDQLQPKLHAREYLKPGDALPHKQPQLFLVNERKHIAIDDEQFSRQYGLEGITWNADSKSFTFEYNERGHQRYRVVQVLAPSGDVKVLIDETSPTFIDYSGKHFRRDVGEGREIIWTSERDGWNHLYLYDVATASMKNQITKGQWVVRSVVYVDEQNRRIFFSAAGLDPDQDPYLEHFCVVNFDGAGFRRLTTSNANHSVVFSDDFQYFVDQQSRVDLPSTTRLFETATVSEKMLIQQADVTDLLATGWRMPEVFSAKGRDGSTDIWGIVIRPTNFDPNKKYPVIEMVYAGPQSFYVPKSWNNYFGLHTLAELGFIVVQVDGMGTSWRSKVFHDVCWKNLKDAGFTDRIAWIKALGEKYSYIDVSRVGIYGGSAGGQNAAAAVMHHADFYRAAVASCGSHDNRVDKIWWNEQWMGYPVGPEYAESSNAVNAQKLGGKLMLIVGELDDNVDPSSTLQVANALIKAKKNFELVVIPGLGHSGGGEFGERKRRDFFVKHLHGVEPPDWDLVYGQKSPGATSIK